MANVWDLQDWRNNYPFDIEEYLAPDRSELQERTFRGRILPTVKADSARRVREGTMPPGKSLKKYKKWLRTTWLEHQADARLTAEAFQSIQDTGHNKAKGLGGMDDSAAPQIAVGPAEHGGNRAQGKGSGVAHDIASEIGATDGSMDSWTKYLMDHKDPLLLPEERALVYHYGRSPENVLAMSELNARRVAEGLPPLIDPYVDNRIGNSVLDSPPVRQVTPPTKAPATVVSPGGSTRTVSTPKKLDSVSKILNLGSRVELPGPFDNFANVGLTIAGAAATGQWQDVPGTIARTAGEDIALSTGLGIAARTPWGQTAIRAVTPFVEPVVSTLLANPIAAAGGLIAADIAFGQEAGAGSATWGPSTPYKDEDDYLFRMGGGNAYMTKTGASIEDTIKHGNKNIRAAQLNTMKEYK